MFAWPSYAIQDLWAGMLEDDSFVDNFFATNQKRLAEGLAMTTEFLDKHKIPYYGDMYALSCFPTIYLLEHLPQPPALDVAMGRKLTLVFPLSPRKSNAGVFLWVDLRRHLLSFATPVAAADSSADAAEAGLPDLSRLRINSDNVAELRQKELGLTAFIMSKGMSIAPGLNFFADEAGWFRITFSAPKDLLQRALAALAEALTAVEQGVKE